MLHHPVNRVVEHQTRKVNRRFAHHLWLGTVLTWNSGGSFLDTINSSAATQGRAKSKNASYARGVIWNMLSGSLLGIRPQLWTIRSRHPGKVGLHGSRVWRAIYKEQIFIANSR